MSDKRNTLWVGVALAAVVATALAGPAAAAAADRDPTVKSLPSGAQLASPDSFEELASRLNPALTERRFEDALAIAKALAAHREFAQAPDPARLATFYLIGILNLDLDRPEAAVAPLVTATGMTGATADHWQALINAEARTGEWDAVALSLIQLLRRFPDALDEMNPDFMIQRARDPDMDEAVGLELRALLLAAGWHHPAESSVWMIHIEELMAAGEIDRARALVGRLTAPAALIQLHALHRYDILGPDLPPLDIEALMAAALEEDRLKAAAADADMAAYSSLSNELYSRGRLDEALATADAALALPEPEVGSKDWRDLTWVMDTRARTLMALGRYGEALTQMQVAAARVEGGRANVSQTINLSWLHLRLDQNAEAVATLSDFDRSAAAPFGVMQAVQVQACAFTALGDTAAADAAYAHLASHWRDAPGAAMEALLCRDDIDGAAALMVQRLDDPDHAATALSELHLYLPNPAPTPFDQRLRTNADAVAARADVLAARDRVGRVLSIPTLGGQF